MDSGDYLLGELFDEVVVPGNILIRDQEEEAIGRLLHSLGIEQHTFLHILILHNTKKVVDNPLHSRNLVKLVVLVDLVLGANVEVSLQESTQELSIASCSRWENFWVAHDLGLPIFDIEVAGDVLLKRQRSAVLQELLD